MEAPVPCDDRWPRRTWEWNEPGPKAKEWGTERPWSEWESRASSLFVFNRELSTAGSSQILRLVALLSSLLWPWGVFPWWAECLHARGRSRPTAWGGGGRAEVGSSGAFLSTTACAINSWVW